MAATTVSPHNQIPTTRLQLQLRPKRATLATGNCVLPN